MRRSSSTPTTPGLEFVMPEGTAVPVGDQDKTMKRGMITAIHDYMTSKQWRDVAVMAGLRLRFR